MEFGIDINELENSEEAIFDDKTPVQKTVKPDQKTTVEDTDIEEDENAILLEDIAELGSDDNLEDDDLEDETKKTNNKKTPVGSGEQNSSSQGNITFLASALAESGVFSSLGEDELKEIDNADKLLDAIAKQIKANELSDLTEDQKQYVEALRTGVPNDEYTESKTLIQQYKSIDNKKIEDNVNIQFELIRRSLIAEGISEERAKKLATVAAQSEEGYEEALQAKQALIANEESKLTSKIEAAKKANEDKLAKDQEELSSLKSKINEASELIPGIKVNSQTKEKIFESLTSPVKVEGSKMLNEVMESYKNPEYKMKLHALHVITNGFKDFSKFTQTTKSKVAKDLEEKLNNQGTQVRGSGSIQSTQFGGKTASDISKALDNLKLF
jgi:hypothetical protein